MKHQLSCIVIFCLFIFSCKKNSVEQIEKDKTPIVDTTKITGPTKPVITLCDTTNITYNNIVKTILATNCGTSSASGCHSVNPSSDPMSNFAETKGFANGNPTFLNAINHKLGASPMPKNGTKLANCDILKITAWINQGFKE